MDAPYLQPLPPVEIPNFITTEGIGSSNWYTFATAIAGIVVMALIYIVSPKQRDIRAAAIAIVSAVTLFLYASIADYCLKTNSSFATWFQHWNPFITKYVLFFVFAGGALSFMIARYRYTKLMEGTIKEHQTAMVKLNKDFEKRAFEAEEHASYSIEQAEQKAAEKLRQAKKQLADELEVKENSLAQAEAAAIDEQRRIDQMRAEDRIWSANPCGFFDVDIVDCAINIDRRSITARLSVHSRYTEPRTVWICGNLAIYRNGTPSPLFIVSLPVVLVDTKANATVKQSVPWPGIMTADQAAEAKAIYIIDKDLRVQLVSGTITTVSNLSSVPRLTSAQLTIKESIRVVQMHYEHDQPTLISAG